MPVDANPLDDVHCIVKSTPPARGTLFGRCWTSADMLGFNGGIWRAKYCPNMVLPLPDPSCCTARSARALNSFALAELAVWASAMSSRHPRFTVNLSAHPASQQHWVATCTALLAQRLLPAGILPPGCCVVCSANTLAARTCTLATCPSLRRTTVVMQPSTIRHVASHRSAAR